MLVIDLHKWASALDGYGLIKHGKHRGGAVISEQSLRYKIKDGREFLDLTNYNIHGHLKLKNFNNLGELNCSSERKFNELTKDYNDYTRNNITILDLSECPGLIKLDCSSNVGLIVLNIRNCSNLVNINVVGCLGLRKIICDNTPHSPEKIIEQVKGSFCLNQECREMAYYNGYCNMHRRHCCKEKGCNSQIYISKEYCNMHQKHCCKDEGCNLQIYISKEYCNMHRKHYCKEKGWNSQIYISEEYCNMHQKHCCKEEGCNSQIYISKKYCSAHQSICKMPGCSFRVPLNIKSELHSKSIFPAKQTKREEPYQNYLDRLLDAQKQSDQQVSLKLLLGKKGEECLTKKLGDEKIKSICQTQMELTKLEKD
ncbi:hypothetical protein F8M41_025580 [Gigaspora margarita]|uniref:Uncharacterized protein n=1 Tax=Gigaspora margarita TaxID=4874 RepID=A0A8H3XI92_GIGMA|nr:hypothetical protein F8M41_025580 [Gigaspora margarita]